MGRLVKNPDLVANAGSATGSGQISAGTTAQRPSNTDEAHIRYNLTTSALEYWSGAAWTQVGKTGLTTVVVDSLTGANGVKVLFHNRRIDFYRWCIPNSNNKLYRFWHRHNIHESTAKLRIYHCCA
jgi:hypothetical protein